MRNMYFQYGSCTIKSKTRAKNADFALANRRAGVVCDGVSSGPYADTASALAANTFLAKINEGVCADEAMQTAHNLLIQTKRFLPTKNFATTLVGAVLSDDGDLLVTWAGDSSCYVFHANDDKLTKITKSQSADGRLLSALGCNRFFIQKKNNIIYTGDKILLCSDGINLSDAQIISILNDSCATPSELATKIVFETNTNKDDRTALVLAVVEEN
jgi:serine/threonine protein phosphatase PrpC